MICMLCGHEIQRAEPRFYFPRLPSDHVLAGMVGVMHVSCLTSANRKREISAPLAEIAEGLARQSSVAPFIARDGDIVLRCRLEEGRMELLDFEDFCEISIPNAVLGRLQNAMPGESISLGMQILKIREGGVLEVESKMPSYEASLHFLNFERLKELLSARAAR